MSNIDYLSVLAANGWALIPIDCPNVGGDSCTMWVVVGYFMGKPYERVMGESWDEDKPHLAIEDALKVTKESTYHYKYDYKDIK